MRHKTWPNFYKTLLCFDLLRAPSDSSIYAVLLRVTWQCLVNVWYLCVDCCENYINSFIFSRSVVVFII